MALTLRFDDSLPAFLDVIASILGYDRLSALTLLRDATGRLSAVVDDELEDEVLASLTRAAQEKLGHYARADFPVRDRRGPGAARIIEEGGASPSIRVGDLAIKLLDRRTVGADWVKPPAHPPIVPCVAFASLKGGVGRSTALAVVAAHLSTRGLRVLAVDLDLEAPGIGTMLLSDATLPKYGTLDYLVENGISGIDDQFLQDMSGKSSLGSLGGQVTVLPAIGSSTIANASSALAKIARAYIDDVGKGGEVLSLSEQVRELVRRFSSTGDYDVVLVDGRAGLHELTASVLLGLGAEVLFFGIDEPQTFLGYRLLLSHLAQYDGPAYEEWLQRIAFVNAKAAAELELQVSAAVKFADLASLFPRRAPVPTRPAAVLTENDFELVWDTPDLTEEFEFIDDLRDQWPIVHVLDDSRYRSFDPREQRALLTSEVYDVTFGQLIEYVENLIPALEADNGAR